MADCTVAQSSAPGVIHSECWWMDEYEGSREALISAGLVRADQLPGQPGMPKSSVTFYDGQRVRHYRGEKDERYMCVTLIAGKRISVVKGISAELRSQRDAEERARFQAAQEDERRTRFNAIHAECKLTTMVSSADEYRQKMTHDLKSYVHQLRDRDMLPNDNHGFSIDRSVVDELDTLLADAIDLILNADIRFDARRHQENILAFRSAMAKGDSTFQRTLEHLTQSASESTRGA